MLYFNTNLGATPSRGQSQRGSDATVIGCMLMSFSLLHLLLEFGQDVRWQFVLAVTFQVWLPAYVKGDGRL